MSTILSLASEYLDCGITKFGTNIYGLDFADGNYSSLRIFTDTDSAYHYSEQRYYTPETFARYIIGLSGDELEELLPEIKQNELLNTFDSINGKNHNTGLSLQDVVAKPGYNDYLKDKRNINESTSKQFGIEVSDDDDIYIPLHDLQDYKRVGSLIRSSSCNDKCSRYRTQMIGSHTKPLCWPSSSLRNVQSDTVFIIVEGSFSLMRIQQICLYKTTNIIPLATLTNNFDEDLFNLLHEFPLIAIPDNDKGGQKIVNQCKEYIKKGGNIEIYKPVDELDEPLFLDDATDEQLKGLFNSIYRATKFTFNFK